MSFNTPVTLKFSSLLDIFNFRILPIGFASPKYFPAILSVKTIEDISLKKDLILPFFSGNVNILKNEGSTKVTDSVKFISPYSIEQEIDVSRVTLLISG